VVPAGTGPVVVVDAVRKRFEDKEVLRGVSFDVRRGETLVIMGGSGSGKTVMLRLVAGLIRPSSGTIRVFDRRIDNLTEEELLPIRRRLGYVFQGAALFDSLSVFENVAYPLREHTDLAEAAIGERVAHVLSLVGLGPDVLRLLPAELSGGMRKRVGVARAIALEPKGILYDEPTTGLDPITSETINLLINKLRDQQNVASIVVTHDIGSALTVGDRFAMLKEGHIIFEGDSDAVQQTQDPYVRTFIDARMKGA
jgi:phospholipid/cholesterol/gamma-HCH transport system ATP-binding protein